MRSRGPARALDARGFHRTADAARRLAWYADFLAPSLRPRRVVELTRLWLREHLGRRVYRVLDEQEILATRSSDTAFVFGSGRSLIDISEADWTRIAEYNTIGFSHLHRLQEVRIDYHLVAEVANVDETAASIRANPFYAETVFLVMRGWVAEASNALVGRRLLPEGARLFRFRRIGRGMHRAPTKRLDDGLVHGTNSSLDVVNFALVGGWKRVVVAGVDLYNKEYFFLPAGTARPDEKPEFSADSPFQQAEEVVAMFELWRAEAERRGIELYTFNPRSRLAEVLPVFRWDD